MIEAKILCDSISPIGYRLITWYLKYPRFIHAELLRHRMFSHSVMSSRAVKTERMIEKVMTEPVIPCHWGMNQKGMSAEKEIDDTDKINAQIRWLEARDNAVKSAEHFLKIGVHKQLCNRILEPFLHIEEVMSGTDYGNFFNLRVHKAAQPEFQELAKEMLIAYNSHTPTKLGYGKWHLPCIEEKHLNLTLSEKIAVSFARVARSSYANFDGDDSVEKDIALHDRLISMRHLSPAEHQAYTLTNQEIIYADTGNYNGYMQYRKTLTHENQVEFDSEKLLQNLK